MRWCVCLFLNHSKTTAQIKIIFGMVECILFKHWHNYILLDILLQFKMACCTIIFHYGYDNGIVTSLHFLLNGFNFLIHNKENGRSHQGSDGLLEKALKMLNKTLSCNIYIIQLYKTTLSIHC